MSGFVSFNEQFTRGEVEIGPRIDALKSVSAGKATIEGATIQAYPAGQVMARCFDGLFRGVVALEVIATITALTTIPAASFVALGDVETGAVLRVGDKLRVGSATTLVGITAINADGSIVVDTAITAAVGTMLVHDPGVSYGAAAALGSGVNAITVGSGQGARFRVGDTVNIVGVSGAREITDITGDVLTFDGAAGTFAAGAQVVSAASFGDYRICVETTIAEYDNYMQPGNVLAPCIQRGRVYEALIVGATPAIKAALPLIIFDQTTITL